MGGWGGEGGEEKRGGTGGIPAAEFHLSALHIKEKINNDTKNSVPKRNSLCGEAEGGGEVIGAVLPDQHISG